MMLKGAADYASSREPGSLGDAKAAQLNQAAQAALPAAADSAAGTLPAGTGTLGPASSLSVGTSARTGGHGVQQHGVQHGMHAVRKVLARLGLQQYVASRTT